MSEAVCASPALQIQLTLELHLVVEPDQSSELGVVVDDVELVVPESDLGMDSRH